MRCSPFPLDEVHLLPLDEVHPLALDEVLPLPLDEVLPLPLDEVHSLPLDEVLPFPLDEVHPLPLDEVHPLPLDEVHPLPLDEVHQGRIQVWLRGGGEFQLAELMYILGEMKYESGGTYLKQIIKVATNLNPGNLPIMRICLYISKNMSRTSYSSI